MCLVLDALTLSSMLSECILESSITRGKWMTHLFQNCNVTLKLKLSDQWVQGLWQPPYFKTVTVHGTFRSRKSLEWPDGAQRKYDLTWKGLVHCSCLTGIRIYFGTNVHPTKGILYRRRMTWVVLLSEMPLDIQPYNHITVSFYYLWHVIIQPCWISGRAWMGNYIPSFYRDAIIYTWLKRYTGFSISQEICTRFLLCCALLWLYIDWFSHIHQAYFTGTVAI